jgi:broad specificity phosphatase PhoE
MITTDTVRLVNTSVPELQDLAAAARLKGFFAKIIERQKQSTRHTGSSSTCPSFSGASFSERGHPLWSILIKINDWKRQEGANANAPLIFMLSNKRNKLVHSDRSWDHALRQLENYLALERRNHPDGEIVFPQHGATIRHMERYTLLTRLLPRHSQLRRIGNVSQVPNGS